MSEIHKEETKTMEIKTEIQKAPEVRPEPKLTWPKWPKPFAAKALEPEPKVPPVMPLREPMASAPAASADSDIRTDQTRTFSSTKETITDTSFGSVFVKTFISFIIIAAIALLVIWRYRAPIFGHFAEEYMKQAQTSADAGTNTSQAVFTQQTFVVDAVKKTNPAVVSIIISKNVPKYVIDPNSQQDDNDDPFSQMFPGMPDPFAQPQYVQDGTQTQEIGGGSGFFVSSDGLIVTNKHVVDEPGGQYTVLTNDGQKHTATVVALDPILDIALIKIDGTGYPALDLGDSDSLEVGQSVIAIGNALGEFRNTVSVGVVSGLARNITAGEPTGGSETLDQVIQTDAAINPGNSGGPLLDLSGNVIGVNVAVAEGSQSIGFALPINSVKSAIESVEATGKIVAPYLGIRYLAIDEAVKDQYNLSVDYGVLVKGDPSLDQPAVIPGGPADKAGIVENDIILDIDGTKLDQNADITSLIRAHKVGDVITLTVLHKGVQKTVSVTLEAAPQTDK